MNDQFGSALAAIRANRLRSVLTISIIAIGVTALVGIETAIGVLSRQLSESFGRMGSGTLSLVPEAEARPFSWHEASTFAESFADSDEGQVSLSAEITPMAVITADGKRTDPMVSVLAADAAWLPISARTLSQGRNFTSRESASGSAVCLVGHSLARKLFGSDAAAAGKTLSFSGMPYSVIGVLAAQGTLLGGGSDYTLVLPLQAGREWLPEDAQWQSRWKHSWKDTDPEGLLLQGPYAGPRHLQQRVRTEDCLSLPQVSQQPHQHSCGDNSHEYLYQPQTSQREQLPLHPCRR